METVYVTQEGMDKLKGELQELKTKGRAEIAKAIAEARAQGDLSENAEYEAAKEAQAHLEKKISDLEIALANSKVIDKGTLDTSKVTILSTVELKNMKINKVVKYTLVSANEADVMKGKISVASPIGKGVLGKKQGDVVDVETPNGTIQLEILSISI